MSTSTESSSLRAFVSASKQQGASDEFLAAMLTRRGWPADDVYHALADYWAESTGIPVPIRRSGAEAARDAFFHLLSFVTLGIWATALGAVLFAITDVLIPDPISGRVVFNYRSAIAWNLASLGVAFPIYLLAMRFIASEARKAPERLQSGVRKWLTYLALLATAGAVIGDLILLLGYFLLGEVTGRFLVKEFVVLAICGAIFAYYLSSLRWDRETDTALQRAKNRRYAGLAIVGVLVAFVAGIAVSGMPAEQRQREADRKRVQDLQAIARAMHEWRTRKRPGTAELPVSLQALEAERFVERIADPETGVPYTYRPGVESRYTLCATFAFPSEQGADRWAATPFWNHGSGEACFELDASVAPPY
jgi:hypothetical protein